MTLLEAKQLPVNFPAHPHTTLGAIAEKDITYIDFLASQTWGDWLLREALQILCEHYGRKPKKTEAKDDPRQGQLFT